MRYVAQFLSFQSFSKAAVYDILSCKIVDKIIFPARVSQPEPKVSMDVLSIEDIKVSDVVNHFSDQDILHFSVYGRNRVELFFTLWLFDKGSSSNVIGFKFESIENEAFRLDLDIASSLILEILPIFKPFYAAVYDRATIRRLRSSGRLNQYKLHDKEYPLRIQWLTYFGPEMLDFLGKERFLNLKTCYDKCEYNKGILVTLLEDIYDDSNSEHQKRQEQAEKELGFSEFL